VNQFNMKRAAEDGPNFSPHLRSWLLALSHVLSRLERHHAPLIEAIMNIPWATLDSTFVKSYTAFIGMLLSAQPEYLSLVLGKIAQGFTHRESCC
jgi:RNA polymerase I-specific transcription initiation factor RRN3